MNKCIITNLTPLTTISNDTISYVLNPIMDKELIELIKNNNWGLGDDIYEKQLELNPYPRRTLEMSHKVYLLDEFIDPENLPNQLNSKVEHLSIAEIIERYGDDLTEDQINQMRYE